MNILLDGVSVFIDNWQLITGILVFITILLFPLFSRLKTEPSTGSPVPAALAQAGRRLESVFNPISIFLALFIAISLLLRLAYVSQALLPSYFDSAQHYVLIKGIMTKGLLWAVEILRTDYYHMGYHFITAFFVSIFQADIAKSMLIIGQVILAILPLPFFFIIRHVTKSNGAAFFCLVLSAFGWYMPAHAADWGKYPALMSLWMITLVFILAYTSMQSKIALHSKKRIVIFVLCGLSILVTALVHSRSLIVIGIVFAAWMVSMWWGTLSRLSQRLILLPLLVAIIAEILIIQRNEILSLLLDPYIAKGILTTILVLVLSVFAYRLYPQFTFAILIAICFLLAAIFVAVNGLFSIRPYLTLLDRPYVEMILFMPLSLLGGLGLAGLEKKVKSPYQNYAALIVVGLTSIYTLTRYEFYPSNCCVIVGNNDLAAMTWMQNQLPIDTRIGVASRELKVVVDAVAEGDVGTDAGIWVMPLTGQVSILLPNNLDFDQQTALDMLCRMNIQYLFIGEMGQPFDTARLTSRPTWYRPLLTMSGTRVYEVIGCDR